MITWSRSVGTTGEKLAGLLKYAHEAAEYTKSKTGFDIKVEVPIGGNPMRVRWTAQYENLATYEQAWAKLLSDPKFMDLIAKATQHVLPGSAVDELWRTS